MYVPSYSIIYTFLQGFSYPSHPSTSYPLTVLPHYLSPLYLSSLSHVYTNIHQSASVEGQGPNPAVARLVEQARNALGQGLGQGQKTTKEMKKGGGKEGKKGKGKDAVDNKEQSNHKSKQPSSQKPGVHSSKADKQGLNPSKRVKTTPTSSSHRDNDNDEDNGDCLAAGEGQGLDGDDEALPVGEYVTVGEGGSSGKKKKKNKAKKQQGKDAKDFGVGRRYKWFSTLS